MTALADPPLDDQRRLLRARLLAQRRIIARQLGPEPARDDHYPRSRTMRFLTRRPALAATLLAELATMLLGARLLRGVTRAMAVARLVRSI